MLLLEAVCVRIRDYFPIRPWECNWKVNMSEPRFRWFFFHKSIPSLFCIWQPCELEGRPSVSTRLVLVEKSKIELESDYKEYLWKLLSFWTWILLKINLKICWSLYSFHFVLSIWLVKEKVGSCLFQTNTTSSTIGNQNFKLFIGRVHHRSVCHLTVQHAKYDQTGEYSCRTVHPTSEGETASALILVYRKFVLICKLSTFLSVPEFQISVVVSQPSEVIFSIIRFYDYPISFNASANLWNVLIIWCDLIVEVK